MPTNSNSDINTEYSSAIKEKLAERRNLHKLWQTNKCPIITKKLNRAIKALKNLLDMEEGAVFICFYFIIYSFTNSIYLLYGCVLWRSLRIEVS